MKIYIQEIQELNLKSTVNFLKLMVKNMHGCRHDYGHANAIEQLGRIAYPCGFNERH